MRIIFMGTGEIALPSLQWLIDRQGGGPDGHELVAVYTQPDKPIGRRQVLTAPETKILAEGHGVRVRQPDILRGNAAALAGFAAFRPDLVVVMAYGQILPKSVISSPTLACVNLHASLLPRHRGASPIQAAIREGDAESGITLMHIVPKLDAGDMILKEAIPILPDDTGGTWMLSELDFALLRESAAFPWIAGLLLVAAFTKSAQIPFHLWLPTAMEAPTPVSAYLHSATMVKAGIILMAKFNPLFAGNIFGDVTMYVGLVTMLFGGWLAMRQTDLKALLAYSTISQLGLLTALLGAGDTFGATVHLINHAVFKAALFMVVGIMDHQTGSRDLRVLSGLGRVLPVTAVIGVIAAISMAGVPPMGGFISKELFIGNMLEQGNIALMIAVIGSAFTFAYTLRFSRVFFGKLRLPRPDEFKRATASLVGPAVPLALAVVLFGIFPWEDTVASFFARLAQPFFGYELIPLTVWHGWTPALYLSIGGWVGGSILYLFSEPVRRFQAAITPRWNANTVYYALVRGLVELAERFTRLTQGASFATHLRFILAGAAAVGLVLGTSYLNIDLSVIPPSMYVGIVFILVGTFGMILALSRITILVFMSAIGFGTTLLYVMFRAPDLALTQLLIETVTVILFLSGFRFLPRLKRYSRPLPVAGLDAALGAGVGLSIALLLLAVQTPIADRIQDFYLTFSKTIAGGDNVVNVMLVDFRSFDTLGEITVLTIVAVSIYALLRLRTRPAGAPETKSLEEENE